jgi:hypothetical protein
MPPTSAVPPFPSDAGRSRARGSAGRRRLSSQQGLAPGRDVGGRAPLMAACRSPTALLATGGPA